MLFRSIDSDGNPWVTGADASNGTGEDHAAEGGAIYKWVPLTLKNNYTVIFKNGSTTVKTQEVEEGQSATAPIITKAGYTLSWDKSFSNVTSDLTVNAVWTANTNTRYVVQHYIQNTSLNGYIIQETENKTGTTDRTATAVAKMYTGFIENTNYSGRVPSGVIDRKSVV